MEEFLKYAIEMGSGAMIYLPRFIKIGSAIQKLIGGCKQTHRQHGDRISLFPFLQNNNRPKNGHYSLSIQFNTNYHLYVVICGSSMPMKSTQSQREFDNTNMDQVGILIISFNVF
jgi:hypothetical protein